MLPVGHCHNDPCKPHFRPTAPSKRFVWTLSIADAADCNGPLSDSTLPKGSPKTPFEQVYLAAPRLNALLNGSLPSCCLAASLDAAIRQWKRGSEHTATSTPAALALSALFLISYVAFHHAHRFHEVRGGGCPSGGSILSILRQPHPCSQPVIVPLWPCSVTPEAWLGTSRGHRRIARNHHAPVACT